MAARHEVLAELLHAVHRGMFEHVKDVLQKNGLPATSMGIMRQVHLEQGITVSEIARRIGVVKSHVSKTVDGLAHEGFLEKRPDPADQRLVRIYTTLQAGNHFGQMQAEIRERLSDVLSAVPEEKVEAIIEGLQILKAVLGQGKGC